MKLFIAEKPELGRAIAGGLDGTASYYQTHIKKGDNIITWAFGHILGLAEPQAYNPKYEKWNINDLPFEVNKFKYIPLEKSKQQLKVICDFIKSKDITEIVHCGDADDEGQILIDEILEYANNTKPVSRLLINDNTEKGVKTALTKIRPNSEFYRLSQRGFARSQADWIVGLNLTRAFTIFARSKGYNEVLTLGRVQTPILSMVVNRDYEHTNFKSSFYYSISALFGLGLFYIKANLKTDEKITDENQANLIKSECEKGTAKIDFIKTEHKTENPPLPYSLLKLQVDCSKILGLKPDKTLEITQNLREKYKAITYNRSDCEYLPVTLWESSPETIDSLKANFTSNTEITKFINSTNTSIKSIAFNDENITAHHAIIPTAQKLNLSDLTKDEANVYMLIVKRFLAQFFEKKEFDSTQIQISVGEHKFQASQINVTKHTFDDFIGSSDKKEKDDENESEADENKGIDFRNFSENDFCSLDKVEIAKKKTNPKPLYTMATLLKDLTGVAKYAKDERIKKLLLEKDKGKKGENGGIGTPATRSNHLKNLVDKGYIVVSDDKKQTITSTEKGKELIKNAPNSLRSADMTALWFEMQKDIEDGNLTKDDFLAQITQQISDEIANLKGNTQMSFDSNAPKCPKCGSILKRHESKNKKGSYWWGCSNYQNCDIGFINDNNEKPDFEAKKAKTSEFKCPKCGSALIRRENKNQKGKFWWGCSNYKNCDIGFIDDNNGKPNLEAKKKMTFRGFSEVNDECPRCGKALLLNNNLGIFGLFICSDYKNCKFKAFADEDGDWLEDIGEYD